MAADCMNPGVYLYLLFAGLVAALLCVPVFKYLSLRWGVMDEPRPGRIHKRATPLLGGPAIFMAMFLVVGGHFVVSQVLARAGLLAGWLPPETIQQLRYSIGAWDRLAAIFAGALIILAVGVIDDAHSLPVWARLGAETAAAVLVVAVGIRPELYVLPRWMPYVVAVVWIVGITNSFNLIDSMDGLATGVALIAAALLGFWAALSGQQPMVVALLACFVGVLAGFLLFNSSPASIFLGSSGSLLLGYFLSLMVLVTTFMTGHSGGLMPLVMPLVILGVPLYDTASVVIIRLRRGRSPFSPDLNHLAHRVHRLGLSRRQTVLFVYLVTFAVGIGAMLLAGEGAHEGYNLKGAVVLVQILAVFGVIVVLEVVGLGQRSVRLATPVSGAVDLEELPRLPGQVTRLGLGGADMDLDDLDAGAAGRMLTERSAGTLVLDFEPPFGEVRVHVRVRALERIEAARWRVSLDFPAVEGEVRKKLEFALEHYRAMGEG